MKNINYLTILIILTIFMLLYGGHNFRKKVIYDGDYFLIFNQINFLSDEIKKKTLFITNKYKNQNYILNMTKKILCDKIIPNCSNVYIINVKSGGIINIEKLMNIQKLKCNIYLMIIFDYLENNKNNKNNFLNIIMDDDYKNNNDYNNKNKYGLFYSLDKKINISDIYNIYNPTNHDILFSLFLVKKPFWSY
jgi:hypothetical protein